MKEAQTINVPTGAQQAGANSAGVPLIVIKARTRNLH